MWICTGCIRVRKVKDELGRRALSAATLKSWSLRPVMLMHNVKDKGPRVKSNFPRFFRTDYEQSRPLPGFVWGKWKDGVGRRYQSCCVTSRLLESNGRSDPAWELALYLSEQEKFLGKLIIAEASGVIRIEEWVDKALGWLVGYLLTKMGIPNMGIL